MDNGEVIEDYDLDFLERVLEDARSVHTSVDRRPEVQPLYAQVTELYHDITTKGLENERNKQG